MDLVAEHSLSLTQPTGQTETKGLGEAEPPVGKDESSLSESGASPVTYSVGEYADLNSPLLIGQKHVTHQA